MIFKQTFVLLSVMLLSRNSYKLLSKPTFYAIRELSMKREKSNYGINDGYEINKHTNNKYTSYLPKSMNQERYCNALSKISNKIVIVIGPAGTGKTMFACLNAISLLKDKKISKIIITRPVVTVEEDIGFLPGNLVKKMDPWTRPLFDIFLEYFSKTELDNMINNNVIEISPLGFMRGRTFKNAYIIADEMQNSSPNQMKMLATRIGFNSKMVITGDLHQSDKNMENGLNDIITKVQAKYKDRDNSTSLIEIVNLGIRDVERSDIVKEIIDIYENDDKQTIIKPKVNFDFDSLYKRP